MVTRVEGGLTYTQVFDAENRLISVTVSGQTTQFIYDGDGNLVKKIKPDGSKTIYVGGIYEVDKNAGGSVTRVVTYYPLGGAMRINSTLYYILKDHLGSASVVTDASGNILGENRYYPFGETRLTTGSILTDKLYTGQREMTGLGIYHYGARFYSPKLGRFLSADTMVPNAANTQAFNRYSYVYNNPINYIDPSGHLPGYFDPIKSVSSVGGGGCYITNCGLPLPPPPCTRNCGDPNPRDDDDHLTSVVPAGDVCEVTSCTQELPSNICPIGETCIINSPSDFWVDWYGVANFSQDLATTVSGIGAGAELVFIADGCVAAGLVGCFGGVLLANFVWVGTGLNGVEQGLGFVSLVSTGIGDYQDDGAFGEATRTSTATFVAGFISTDPIIDLAIDGYASGYNHGYFCGVDTIISCLGNP